MSRGEPWGTPPPSVQFLRWLNICRGRTQESTIRIVAPDQLLACKATPCHNRCHDGIFLSGHSDQLTNSQRVNELPSRRRGHLQRYEERGILNKSSYYGGLVIMGTGGEDFAGLDVFVFWVKTSGSELRRICIIPGTRQTRKGVEHSRWPSWNCLR